MRVVFALSFLTLISIQLPWIVNSNQNPDPAVEAAKQRYARLRRADFASLEIKRIPPELNQAAEEGIQHFKINDRIRFQVVLTNISNTPILVPIGDELKQIRPKLIKDGDSMPYRKSLDELLAEKEKELMFTAAKGANLNPGENVAVYLDLRDWYEPLKRGHYELSVKERFMWDGQWVESSSIAFEVAQ